jgi:hypothetical protein
MSLLLLLPDRRVGVRTYGVNRTGQMPNWTTGDLNDMAQRGIRLLRTSFNQHDYDLSGLAPFDTFMAATASRGIQVLPVLINLDGETYAPPTTPYTEWKEFISNVVARFGPDGTFWQGVSYYLPIRCWEVWNEQNLSNFWPGGPDPGAYYGVLKSARDAIRGADSEGRVLFGGLADKPVHEPIEFFDDVCNWPTNMPSEPKGKYLFDAVSDHPYSDQPADVEDKLDALRDAVKTQTGAESDVQIWVTEISWTSTSAECDASPPAETEEGQRDQLEDLVNDVISPRRQDCRLGPTLWWVLGDYSGCAAGLWEEDRDEKLAGQSFATYSRGTPALLPLPPRRTYPGEA